LPTKSTKAATMPENIGDIAASGLGLAAMTAAGGYRRRRMD